MTGTQIVRDALARHRADDAIGLNFTLPISWQLDVDLSRALEADLKSTGQMWEVQRATPSAANMIPARTGLYMFVYRSHLRLQIANSSLHTPTWILYVGKAGGEGGGGNLKARYRSEYANYLGQDPEGLWSPETATGRKEVLGRYLRMWPLEYWFLIVDDRAKIAALEDRLIKLLSPPLNKYGRLRVKTSAAMPAFKEY